MKVRVSRPGSYVNIICARFRSGFESEPNVRDPRCGRVRCPKVVRGDTRVVGWDGSATVD